MAAQQHSKLLYKAAREVLKPIGVVRKGQSRTWLDDQGWWITVIEFQPSSWSKGSYLNVGVNWQWHVFDGYSFDLGYREEGYIEYHSDEQFEPEAMILAQKAKDKVEEYRENLSQIGNAMHFVLRSSEEHRPTLRTDYHCGMVCALAHKLEKAIFYFERAISAPENANWAVVLKENAKHLCGLIREGQEYTPVICGLISESRRSKKLDVWDCEFK